MDDFTRFWLAYPRRIAKGAARKAFAIALRKTALETMLAAVEAYKRNKPAYADWAHASSWLNQERWLDEWEGETIKPAANECLMRKVRDLDELKRVLIEAHGHIPPNLAGEIARAKSLDDVSPVLRNRLVPNLSNVVKMERKA